MSRIGNTPITKVPNVTLTSTSDVVTVVGSKGQIVLTIANGLAIREEGNEILVEKKGASRKMKALHGALAANVKNAMIGVSSGWSKTLELNGVGYRAAIEGANLVLTVGFSHPVKITPPQGVQFQIQDGKIVVSGFDKYLVGQVAASVRMVKPPEPYKGKGIRYSGEVVRKKAGKSAKAVGGAPGAK